jgi:hypothetical protein
VKAATQTVLERLDSLKFDTSLGDFAPFEERIPLVSGIAWEAKTAQLALIAEDDGEVDPSAWKQLIFAASGLRHHLGGTDTAAFGAPVIVGIIGAEGVRTLRCLVEEIAHDYVVFNRVDLNLLLRDDVASPEKLDQALAPLLPRCRESLGEEISREEVQRFWQVLRGEVHDAAEELDEMFGDRRARAGRQSADALIGDLAGQDAPPSPTSTSSMAPTEAGRRRSWRLWSWFGPVSPSASPTRSPPRTTNGTCRDSVRVASKSPGRARR